MLCIAAAHHACCVKLQAPETTDLQRVSSFCHVFMCVMPAGEVLEEMKRQHNVQGNGGLLVTCLLEDDSAPIISPGGVPASDMLRLIDDTVSIHRMIVCWHPHIFLPFL